MRNWKGALAGLALAACATTAFAEKIYFETASGHSGPGAYEGCMEYVYSSGPFGTLSITLKNTSDANNGGYITGFGFNADGSVLALLTNEPSGSAWNQLFGSDALTLNPYGTFEFGASTGDKLQSNSNANAGIGVGEQRTFTFSIFGLGLSSLETGDFLSELSSGANGDNEGEFFIARFGAFDDEDSDKAGATLRHVPLPPAGLAGLLMLLGLGAARSRRRRRNAA